MSLATRNDLIYLCRDRGYTTIAEVGVLYGGFSSFILKTIPNATVWSIDPWRNLDGGFLTDVHRRVVETLAQYGDRSHIVIGPSPQISDEFDDHVFDLVYLDGDHRYEAVKDDLAAWFPKVKPGGIFAGDDYGLLRDGHPGLNKQLATPLHQDLGKCEVMRAVNEFAHDRGLGLNVTTVETNRVCPQWYFQL